MNTCKTCAHWQDSDSKHDWFFAPEDPDTGEPIERGFQVKRCRYPQQTFCELPYEHDGFGLVDGSTYFAMLATAEDFGCVKWRSK